MNLQISSSELAKALPHPPKYHGGAALPGTVVGMMPSEISWVEQALRKSKLMESEASLEERCMVDLKTLALLGVSCSQVVETLEAVIRVAYASMKWGQETAYLGLFRVEGLSRKSVRFPLSVKQFSCPFHGVSEEIFPASPFHKVFGITNLFNRKKICITGLQLHMMEHAFFGSEELRLEPGHICEVLNLPSFPLPKLKTNLSLELLIEDVLTENKEESAIVESEIAKRAIEIVRIDAFATAYLSKELFVSPLKLSNSAQLSIYAANQKWSNEFFKEVLAKRANDPFWQQPPVQPLKEKLFCHIFNYRGPRQIPQVVIGGIPLGNDFLRNGQTIYECTSDPNSINPDSKKQFVDYLNSFKQPSKQGSLLTQL